MQEKSSDIFRNIQESRSEIYKIGAGSALIILIVYLIDLGVVASKGLPPKTVPELFDLFQQNRLVGLLQAFSLDIIAATLHVPVFIALFFSLLKIKKSFAFLLMSVVFSFVGIAVYFSYNSVFSMVYLSDQYAIASDAVTKQQLLSAGHTFLSSFNANGTGSFMAFTLYGIAGILISIVMMKSPDYGRSIGAVGIAGNVLQLGPPTGLYPDIWGKIDPLLIGIGGLFLLVWYGMIFIKLLALAKNRE